MEKQINNKIFNYINKFKEDVLNILHETDTLTNIVENYIQNYDLLELDKDDFVRRKRVKNIVPFYERCYAKRANGEQCTRRKKKSESYCGTHIKCQPHGIFNKNVIDDNIQKITVKAQDIKGIIYYIDDYNNVYDPYDIKQGITNPKIIAKYVTLANGDYSIPEFNI